MEKQIRMGRLAELRKKQYELSIRIKANIRSVKGILANASVDKINDIDMPGAMVNMSDAHRDYIDYMENHRNIEQLEKEI